LVRVAYYLQIIFVEQYILFGLEVIVHVGKAVLWDFLTNVAQNPGCPNGACGLVLDVDAHYLDAAAEDKDIGNS
jgi:hypothetical protein